MKFNDHDPSWINDYVRNKIKWKNKIYYSFVKNAHTLHDYKKLQVAINLVFDISKKRKNDYNWHLASKLNDLKTNVKTHWSILTIFYNGQKISIISLLIVNNKTVFDF